MPRQLSKPRSASSILEEIEGAGPDRANLRSPGPEEAAPATPDELHAWIKQHLGIHIPRKVVCEDVGHVAPFDAFSQLWFDDDADSEMWIANRSGGKSFYAALWHVLSSVFYPGCESLTLGAVFQQAERVYKHAKVIRVKLEAAGIAGARVIDSLMKRTEFVNGSEIVAVTSSEKAVNGPHPQHTHRDEIELMSPSILSESLSMTFGAPGIPGRDLYTSTKKKAHGQVAKIEEEYRTALIRGEKPPIRVQTWCIWECAAPVTDCQHDPRNASRPKNDLCRCHTVIKGTHPDGSPRKFSDECGGRLANGDGWLKRGDVLKQFSNNSADVWQAQHTCRQGDRSNLVYPSFSRERHGLRNWVPDPELGFIYTGTDFGGTRPHAHLWCQVLNQEVQLGDGLVLQPWTRIFFGEIYMAGITSEKLAEMVIARENEWRQKLPRWRVRLRFGDAAAKDARGIWRDRGLTIIRMGTRDLGLSLGYVKELLDEDRVRIHLRCKMLIEEIERYSYPDPAAGVVDKPDNPVKDFDHACDAARYLITGLRAAERQLAQQGGAVNPHIYTKPSSGSRPLAGESPWMPLESEYGDERPVWIEVPE